MYRIRVVCQMLAAFKSGPKVKKNTHSLSASPRCLVWLYMPKLRNRHFRSSVLPHLHFLCFAVVEGLNPKRGVGGGGTPENNRTTIILRGTRWMTRD